MCCKICCFAYLQGLNGTTMASPIAIEVLSKSTDIRGSDGFVTETSLQNPELLSGDATKAGLLNLFCISCLNSSDVVVY